MNLSKGFASLCVLSYERPEFFANTLASLEANTTAPYELIIHDDGSQPGLIYEYLWDSQSRDGATVITNAHGHNQGQGIALNRMFKMAKGDPIIKLDADLKFSAKWLESTINILNENPDIGLLGLCHYFHEPVDMRNTVLSKRGSCEIHTHILGSAFALRREAWEKLGPFEEHSDAFAEDWVMQQAVSNHEYFKCALPTYELVNNVGMGAQTSSLFVDGNPDHVRKIHKEPYIINKND